MEPLWMPRTDNAARLLGAAFFAAGAAILYWQIWLPIQEASQGAASVSYSVKLIVFGELFVLLGGLWLVRGLPGYEAVRNVKQKGKATMIVLALIGLAMAAGTMWLMSSQLGALGYSS